MAVKITETITEADANKWIEDNPDSASICVTIKCDECGYEDWFWDDTLRYGPTGESHEHNDTCYKCRKTDKATTTSITVNNKEVVF
ncbi:MAG: hypothetical protein OXC46_03070 [Thaumarchaeota archaeon]|nr:hypothetical protein [Nitrososphaerota archaeon]